MRPLPPARRRRPPLAVSRVVALLALLACAACFHRGRARDRAAGGPEAVPIPEYVFVAVENHNWSDVIISLVQGNGQTIRIGTVTGAASATLRFPGQYIAGAARLQLVARAIGGRTVVRSEGFTVQPGQQVTWTLESSLQRSSLAVW